MLVTHSAAREIALKLVIYAVICCHIIVLIEVATILWSYYDSLFSVNSKLIF